MKASIIALTIILLITFSNKGFSQDYVHYFNSANEAEYQLSCGKLHDADLILSSLEKEFCSLKPKDNFYLGIVKYLEGDTIRGFACLSTCAAHVGFPTEHYDNYRRMFPQLTIPGWHIDSLKIIEQASIKLCRKDIFDTLAYFLKEDQQNRINSQAISPEEDVRIQTAFLEYLEKNGIPDLVMYGDASLAVIRLHLKNEKVFGRYREFLLDQLHKGNIYPNVFCAMVDRHQHDYSRPTVYNSYFGEKISDEATRAEIEKRWKVTGLSPYFTGTNLIPIPDFHSSKFKREL